MSIDPQDQAYLKRLTVLYVEDEDFTRALFTEFLERLVGKLRVPGRVESRFHPALPHQTVRALLMHTAFRCSSLQSMRFLPAR